ncbi:hypothetical protein [Terribacillus aidingensis]|uniref:hypothetical protein n=1 Tax=Terribacillus aidingensis TaxID=586416 RepID=UPI0015CB29F9|nr:hypothetical protein [Terribacillus aidingensis]
MYSELQHTNQLPFEDPVLDFELLADSFPMIRLPQQMGPLSISSAQLLLITKHGTNF